MSDVSPLCSVDGCGQPAAFAIRSYSAHLPPNQKKPLTFCTPDPQCPFLCSRHAALNELNYDEEDILDTYPFTEPNRFARSVYVLLPDFYDPHAEKLAEYLPEIPGDPRWFVDVLRDRGRFIRAARRGELNELFAAIDVTPPNWCATRSCEGTPLFGNGNLKWCPSCARRVRANHRDVEMTFLPLDGVLLPEAVYQQFLRAGAAR